jgi:type VI secretion system secreted protein VgrG
MVSTGTGLLTVGTVLSGDHDGEWQVHAEAVPTTLPYRPELRTPKPVVQGLESATVVGPLGEEIHTDEYGRVRVHFHWDRESQRDQSSSCWLPTSQPWAGAGFGAVNIPRIGQEVLVEFLNGDPDRPVVIGRVYTETNPVPDKLPRYKNVSGLMSESTPRIVMGAADGSPGAAAPSSPLGGGTPLSASEIGELVTSSEHFRAASPTGTSHAWNGSGFKMDDSDGAQIFYLQAQRDFNVVVRNAWRTIVANRRGCIVGTDDQLTVHGAMGTRIEQSQRVDVEGDQELHVFLNRAETVRGNLRWQIGSGGAHIKTETEVINYRACKELRFTSLTKIELTVGGSSIVLEPSRITVEAAESVWLQPAQGAGPRRR